MSSGHPKAPKGARTLILAQLVKAVTVGLGVVVLSRLLAPEEFGLVAVPIAIITVGETLRDMGLSVASVTAKDLTSATRSFLFWVNVVIGVVLAAVVSGIPWAVVVLSSTPAPTAAIFATTMSVLSLVFVVNGVTAQYRAGLNRDMKFSSLAFTEGMAGLLGVLSAIALAYFGAGYWALVGQPIVVAIATLSFCLHFGGWLPGRPRREKDAIPILKFGANLAIFRLLQNLSTRLDVIALGAWGNSTQLGYYSRSQQLTTQSITLLKTPLTSIALPIFSRRVDNPLQFQRAVTIGQTLLMYSIVPVAIFIAAAADPLVHLLLGNQWTAAVPLVAILALAGGIGQMVSVADWVLTATNEGRLLRRYGIITLLVKGVFVISAAPFGPLPVALAFLGANIVTSPILHHMAWKSAGLDRRTSLQEIAVPTVVMTAAGAAAWLCATALDMNALAETLICGAAFVLAYAASALVPRVRSDLRVVIGVIANR